MKTRNDKDIVALQSKLSTILAQIRHENELLNHRLTWMWTLQGLLFAALGVLLSAHPERFVALILCLVGIVSCILIGYSLLIGIRVLDILNPHANQLSDVINSKLGLTPEPLTSVTPRVWSFLLPWKTLPWFLAFIWLVLGIYVAFWFDIDLTGLCIWSGQVSV